MKRFPPNFSSSRRGFSLIELLVVVAIIVILGGIVISALAGMKNKQAKNLTQVNLKNISMHVENYKTDNGAYPVGETLITIELYKALSGDLSGKGEEPTETIYWPDLLKKDSPIVGISGGQRIILDGYGQSFRYRSALDINGKLNELVKNDGSFDVWSIGADHEPSDPNIDSKTDNDQTKDDIW
ncbi:type II secretion system protein GspG [Akkermansiaceae bacterium]|nr:type II secretion system protein GspG [Akkermansiaceae bacterium]